MIASLLCAHGMDVDGMDGCIGCQVDISHGDCVKWTVYARRGEELPQISKIIWTEYLKFQYREKGGNLNDFLDWGNLGEDHNSIHAIVLEPYWFT